MVAAGTCTVPHRRMPFSNYGSRIDCYAWGEKVNPHHDIRIGLNGTSGATAIIAGAAIALQAIAKAETGRPISPGRIRAMLGNPVLGTASAGGDHMGVLPDLEKILSVQFHKRQERHLHAAKLRGHK